MCGENLAFVCVSSRVILSVIEYLQYCLHALVPDGRTSHGVEHLIQWSKESLNKDIAQHWVLLYCQQSGIALNRLVFPGSCHRAGNVHYCPPDGTSRTCVLIDLS